METQGKGARPVRVSIIIAVLDSHEVVRRQLEYFKGFIHGHWAEVIIMDDGSDPPIPEPPGIKYQLRIVRTDDSRPWSQPCARNAGARIAMGRYLFMTDIDHVISRQALEAAMIFTGDKMVFPRQWAILDHKYRIRTEPDVLSTYGLINGKGAGSHANTFVMRKEIFDRLGGYDESFCGKYGGDDTNFATRYGELHYAGGCERSVTGPPIYVYPEPRQDVKKIFHSLRR